MAFTDIEFQAVKNEVAAFVESRRPPFYLRDQMDLAYRIKDQTVELLQIRQTWQGEPGEKSESVIAKITYARSSKTWKLYWQRGNLTWSCYDTAYTLAEVLEMVREDRHGCFWGG